MRVLVATVSARAANIDNDNGCLGEVAVLGPNRPRYVNLTADAGSFQLCLLYDDI